MRQKPERGVVTIAFDDAYKDTYKHAIKYLDKLGIKSTIAVPSSLIGKTCEKRPIIGMEGLRDAIKFGHEVASHTLTHRNLFRFSLKDKKAAIFEIAKSKQNFQKLLHYKVDSFVFPYIRNNVSKSLLSEAKNYYKSARITRDFPCFNKIPVKDPYRIVGFAVMKRHTLRYLNKQVDYAQKNKLWLIEVFHLVGKKNTKSAHRPKPYRFFTHVDDFKKHLEYILSKDIMILTQKDIVRKITCPTS